MLLPSWCGTIQTVTLSDPTWHGQSNRINCNRFLDSAAPTEIYLLDVRGPPAAIDVRRVIPTLVTERDVVNPFIAALERMTRKTTLVVLASPPSDMRQP